MMNFGWIKVAAGSCDTKVADCGHNASSIINECKQANKRGVKAIVFPELCVSGYTCGDLFFQDVLIQTALSALENILKSTRSMDMLIVVGMPIIHENLLYNCSTTMLKGKVLLVSPKSICSAQRVDSRHFSDGSMINTNIELFSQSVVFSSSAFLRCNQLPEFNIETSFFSYLETDDWEDFKPPACANITLFLGAEPEFAGRPGLRETLAKSHSYKTNTAVIVSMAGAGESTTDNAYSGAGLIADYGKITAKNKFFSDESVISDIDVKEISARKKAEKIRINSAALHNSIAIGFDMQLKKNELDFCIPKSPFISEDEQYRDELAEQTLVIQANALAKRLSHVGNSKPIIGISGGLDSTLALIVCVRAMKISGRTMGEIVGINMPCFGSSDRTKNNSAALCNAYNIDYRIIDISKAVTQHFKDIGQDPNNHDTAFENAQARERTQVLMDIANMENGLVVGTGNISELALGWATYNGDHMSMYAVNAGLPKTLLKSLVEYEMKITKNKPLIAVLKDILNTPISPELLPPVDGEISQSTESIIGPYELHDFFLYYTLKGYSPSRIYNLAQEAFAADYSFDGILNWLHTFFRRFFTQQFKRSVMPDGVNSIGISLSPRGSWQMPSDALSSAWLAEIDELKKLYSRNPIKRTPEKV